MNTAISIKQLRLSLPRVLKDLKNGKCFTLIYRSRPVGELSPYVENRKKTSTLLDLIKSRDHRFRSAKESVRLVREDRDK